MAYSYRNNDPYGPDDVANNPYFNALNNPGGLRGAPGYSTPTTNAIGQFAGLEWQAEQDAKNNANNPYDATVSAEAQGNQTRQTNLQEYGFDLGKMRQQHGQDLYGKYYDAQNASNTMAWDANADADAALYGSYLDAAGNISQSQVNSAKGQFAGVNDFWDKMMGTGGISLQEQTAREAAAYSDIVKQTQAMQQGVNAGNASRGLGGNAAASMALGMSGQFAAAGERGQARADILKELTQNRIAAGQERSKTSAALADLDTMVTAEQTMANLGLTDPYKPHYDSGPAVADPGPIYASTPTAGGDIFGNVKSASSSTTTTTQTGSGGGSNPYATSPGRDDDDDNPYKGIEYDPDKHRYI